LLVGFINQVQNAVEEKGQEIEGEQEAGQMVLPMSKIVFQMIAALLHERKKGQTNPK
jgi:hypothetical protein